MLDSRLSAGEMQLAGLRLLRLSIVLVLVCAACSGTPDAARHANYDNYDAGTGERMDSDGGAETKCGDTPVRLVDYVPEIPDAGRSAIQVPTIAVNDTGLFYLLNWYAPLESKDGPGGYLMHLPRRGGEPVRLAVVTGGGSEGGQGLAVTQGAAIYGEAREGEGSEGALMSVSQAGTKPTTLARTSGLANALVADEQNVYFVDDEGTKSVSLAGGPVRTLTSQRPYSILVAESTLYLADLGEPGSLSSVPIEGGALTVLARESALHPVLCGQSLCWLTGPALDMSLKQLAPDGSSAVLASGLREPHDLVFDGRYFFATTDGPGIALRRIAAGGGTAVVIQGGALMSSLALDDACLYWSEASGIYAWARSAADTAPEMRQ